MDDDTIETLFDRLDDLQQDSAESKRQEDRENGMNRRAAYYLGEQAGVGKAKSAIRQVLSEVDE